MVCDTSAQIVQAIRDRASFLQCHPRITPPEFPRDFIARHGMKRLLEIEAFDRDGFVSCTFIDLYNRQGSAAEKKRLERGLASLVQAGVLRRQGRSFYRIL